VDATFVGHPLADLPAPQITREAYAAEHGLDLTKHWITLMPGSRRKELRMNLPTILEAASRLGDGYEFLLPVARTLEPAFIQGLIETRQAASLRRDRGDRRTDVPPGGIRLVSEALPALYHARVGIIASGTATVEAAIMGTPFVMVYRVSALTYALGKPRVKVPHYAMVNLIAEEEVVPELVQSKFTAANIVAALEKIIPDGEPRSRMIQQLARVKGRLKQDSGQVPPAERAAEIILEAMQ
jgi:lipid-A-disaccharide synthase